MNKSFSLFLKYLVRLYINKSKIVETYTWYKLYSGGTEFIELIQ